MAKFKIAQAPTFGGAVLVPVIGQAPVKVDFTFKYRDRLELATLFDEWNARHKENSGRIGDNSTLSEVVAIQADQQVQQIKDVVVAWGFDDEFSEASILALVNSCGGAAEAVLAAYEDAYSKARSGN